MAQSNWRKRARSIYAALVKKNIVEHNITYKPKHDFAGKRLKTILNNLRAVIYESSGAVWKSRCPSWAFRPNEPYGFCGRKATSNRASALVTVCP